MLWLLAVVLAVFGVLALLQGSVIVGVLLLIAAAVVGPGGYQIGRGRSTV